MNDLSGIFGLPMLEELYLSFNDIKYLEDVSMHDYLSVIDLEANQISDFEQVEHLGTCPKLTSLVLSGCPFTTSGVKEKEYRRIVMKAIPGLTTLDDIDIADNDRKPPSGDVSDSESSSSSQSNNGNLTQPGKIGASTDLFFGSSISNPRSSSVTSYQDRAEEESKFIDESLRTPQKMASLARPKTAGSAGSRRRSGRRLAAASREAIFEK